MYLLASKYLIEALRKEAAHRIEVLGCNKPAVIYPSHNPELIKTFQQVYDNTADGDIVRNYVAIMAGVYAKSILETKGRPFGMCVLADSLKVGMDMTEVASDYANELMEKDEEFGKCIMEIPEFGRKVIEIMCEKQPRLVQRHCCSADVTATLSANPASWILGFRRLFLFRSHGSAARDARSSSPWPALRSSAQRGLASSRMQRGGQPREVWI